MYTLPLLDNCYNIYLTADIYNLYVIIVERTPVQVNKFCKQMDTLPRRRPLCRTTGWNTDYVKIKTWQPQETVYTDATRLVLTTWDRNTLTNWIQTMISTRTRTDGDQLLVEPRWLRIWETQRSSQWEAWNRPTWPRRLGGKFPASGLWRQKGGKVNARPKTT